MAGLFGANAVRSPLSDVPSLKARNSQELNAMVETALLPDMFKKARLVVQAMHPIENIDGFSNEVRLDELDPETAVQVREVLNAGSIIGAVRRHDKDGRYLVRSELLELLNTVIKRELDTKSDEARRSLELDQLEHQRARALMPQLGRTCDCVMSQLDPMNETNGFTSEIYLDKVPEERQGPVLNVLNAGATFQVVQRDAKTADRYYVHKDLYKTLARIRARQLLRDMGSVRLGAPAGGARFGGSITTAHTAIADHYTDRPPGLPRAEIAQAGDATHELRAALLKDLGLDESAYRAAAMPGADAAGKSLEHLKESNLVLGPQLKR